MRRQLFFFFVLDLLFVLAAAILIIVLTTVFSHKAPDTMDMSLVEGSGDVVLLEVSQNKKWVTLSKHGTLWLGEDSESPAKTAWPCNVNKVSSLLTEVSKNVRVYKKADGVSEWKHFGVEEKDCLKLKVKQDDKQAVSWLFSRDIRDTKGQTAVFRTSKGQTVWEAQSTIPSFLVYEADFWADSHAIPSFAPSFAAIGENAAAINRGKLFCLTPASHLVPTTVQQASFTGGIEATFSVYKKGEEYVVRPTFSCPALPEFDLVNYGYIMDEGGVSQLLEVLEEIAR